MPPHTYVDSTEDARWLVNHYMREEMRKLPLGLDSETTGLNIVKDTIVAWSFADAENRYCIPRRLLKEFKPLLEDEGRTWVLTNAKYDAHMFENSGVHLAGRMWDTIVMDWMMDEDRRRGRHGLKETADDHMGLYVKSFDEVFPRKGRGKTRETVGEAVLRAFEENTEEAADYASSDAWVSLMLVLGLGRWPGFRVILQDVDYHMRSAWDHFLQVEVPFTRTLWNMERRGMMVWAGHLESLVAPMEEELDGYLRRFAEEAGETVNLNSVPQLREFFFETLGAPAVKMTKGGASGDPQPSTDADTIETWLHKEKVRDIRDKKRVEISDDVRLFSKLLLEYRGLKKLLGTYVEGLRKWTDKNYRIHPTLNQTGTVTGRLSSRDPNLQNIPRPENDGYGLRHSFIADEDCVLIVADYAQLEMRITAHFSEDPKMIEAIRGGLDVHSFTASLMLGASYEEIVAAKKKEKDELTDEDEKLLAARQAAKTIGFGLLYGEGPTKLAADLEIPVDEAKRLRNKYLDSYPEVRDFIEYTQESCREHEFVRTLVGRYRHLPAINYEDDGLRAYAERQAFNSVIQGSAADIVKKAMLEVEENERLAELGAQMQLQIHDELVIEVPEENAEEAGEIVKEIMETVIDPPLEVPLPVDMHIALSWGEAK